MNSLEALCRRYAVRVGQNGVVYLTHDGDPLLAQAFKDLGWPDRYPETAITPPPTMFLAGPEVAAVVDAPETAVMPKAKRRIWG